MTKHHTLQHFTSAMSGHCVDCHVTDVMRHIMSLIGLECCTVTDVMRKGYCVTDVMRKGRSVIDVIRKSHGVTDVMRMGHGVTDVMRGP